MRSLAMSLKLLFFDNLRLICNTTVLAKQHQNWEINGVGCINKIFGRFVYHTYLSLNFDTNLDNEVDIVNLSWIRGLKAKICGWRSSAINPQS